MHRREPESVLAEFPGLELDDLTAVQEYATYAIRTRTHDEITGRKVLPKDQLQDGLYYKGRCRSATVLAHPGLIVLPKVFLGILCHETV
jgi:hypothetical protein